ncbi:MAG: hypothetical protein K6E63_00150, partial [Lachnospiraceae bacterium]|nr:hypothetical protein [Lachnospiraceae bacterium]
KRYGIEIPYNYVNVVSFEGVKKEAEEDFAVKKANSPIHRHFRTDTVKLINGNKDIVRALEVARSYARRLQLKPHDLKQLELLTEESIGVLENIVNDIPFSFWIEGSGYKYRIHLRFNAKIGSNEYRKLLSLSSSGKNDAIPGLSGKLKEIILLGISNVTSDNDQTGRNDYRWALSENGINEDEIGESILTSIASDIKVSVTKEKVEFLVIKSTQ